MFLTYIMIVLKRFSIFIVYRTLYLIGTETKQFGTKIFI